MKTTNTVPRQLAFCRFGPVSQVNIQASPVCAESKDNPAGIAEECQRIANSYGLPVAFSCETARGVSRHMFFPSPNAARVAKLNTSKPHGEGTHGTHFNRTPHRISFTGNFNAWEVEKQLREQLEQRYEGCLYRPLSIDGGSVREVSPGVCEFVYVSSNGD